MIWFIVSIIIYVSVLSLLFYFTHKGRERAARDKTPTPENELIERHNTARRFTRMGLIHAANAPVPDKTKSGAGCGAVVFIMLYMIVAVGLPCLINFIVRGASVPEGYKQLDIDTFSLSYMAAGAFGLGFVYLAPFASKKIAAAFEKLEKKSNTKIQNTKGSAVFVLLLFSFTILFPFFALGLNFNGSYNENEIRYNAFFAVETSVTPYSEITKVERALRKNLNTGEINSIYYRVTLKGGFIIDIFEFGRSIDQTYEIHGYIKTANPRLFEGQGVTASIEDLNHFFDKEGYGAQTREKILFILDFS